MEINFEIFNGNVKNLISLFLQTLYQPHSSASSTQDLKTGGCWFDPQLVQYSFSG